MHAVDRGIFLGGCVMRGIEDNVYTICLFNSHNAAPINIVHIEVSVETHCIDLSIFVDYKSNITKFRLVSI